MRPIETGLIPGLKKTSSGLGKCLVASVLNRGDYAIATVRKEGTLGEVAATEDQKARLRVILLYVTESEENIRKAANEICAIWGRIDVVVNNAGRGTKSLLEEDGLEVMRTEFETSVFGIVKVTNAVLPHMSQRSAGVIVLLSSRMVWQANIPLESSYLATKAVITCEPLAAEVAQSGIRVVLAVARGFRTSQLDTLYGMKRHVTEYDGYREAALQELMGCWRCALRDPAKAMEASSLMDVVKAEREKRKERCCRPDCSWGNQG